MEKGSAEYEKILDELVGYCNDSGTIDQNLYVTYDVKRGLRDSNGKGVLTGLTEISDVSGFAVQDGELVPSDGRLYIQGYNIEDLERGFHGSKFGFEETIYLLLFGELPTRTQFNKFKELMETFRELPRKFARDVILKAPSKNMMNVLQRCVLTLYSYDDCPDDISIRNVLRQSMELIAQFPLIAAYGYQGYKHYYQDKSLIIHNPKPGLSTAENFLRLIRGIASPIIKKWHPQLTIGLQKQWMDIEHNSRMLSMDRPLFIGRFNNGIQFPYGWTLHVDLFFQGKGDFQNIYINKNVFMMDASLTKSFFDDRLSFNLQGIDLTHGRKDGNVIYNKHMDLTVNNVTDSREVRLTVRYKFNTTKNKYKGKGAAEEEIRRL